MHSAPRLRYCLPLALLLLAGCRTAKDHIAAGDRFFEQQRFDDAALTYRKAIQKDGSSGEAHFGLGKTLLKQNKTTEAYGALRRAVELAPGHADARRLLLELSLAAYLGDTRRPAALRQTLEGLAKDALAKQPDSYDGLRIRGYLALTAGDTAEATALFRKANAGKPLQADVGLTLARLMLQDPATAAEGERLIQDLIQRYPAGGPAYDLLYAHYGSAQRWEEAEALLQRKIAASPEKGEFVLQLADHYRVRQRRDRMEAALDRLIQNKQATRGRLLAGDYWRQIGEPARAAAVYEGGGDAEGGLYQKRLAALRSEQGAVPQALELADRWVARAPQDREWKRLRGAFLLQSRRAREAVAELREVARETPKDAPLQFLLGRALLLSGDSRAAREAWREAAKLAPNFAEPRLALGALALETGQPAESLRYSGEILAFAPQQVEARLLKATALEASGRDAEARPLFAELRRQYPQRADVAVEQAFAQMREQKFDAAERTFREQYKPGAENLRPLFGLVQALTAQKRAADAEALLRADLKLTDRPQVRYLLAEVLSGTGRGAEAEPLLAQADAAGAGWTRPALLLAELQMRRQSPKEAVITLQRLLAAQPDQPAALLLLARAQESAGDYAAAQQAYREAIKRSPDHAPAKNNLAYLIADHGGDLEEALRLANEASRKAPQSPNFADTVGYVYLKMKRTDAAVQVFSGLSQRMPANATFRYHHGLALLESGRKQQARDEFEAALAAKPGGDLAGKVQAALSRAM